MPDKHTRRSFVKGSLAAAAGASLAMSLEEEALLTGLATAAEKDAAADKPPEPVKPGSKGTLPTGKLGKLSVSRVVLGGNLIGGWAHSRDLTYVSSLLRHYFSQEKILQTLRIAEEWGVNCVNTHPNAGELIQRYRKERGGKILWIAQGFPDDDGKFTGIQRSIDQGADSVYIQGNVGDRFAAAKKFDVLAKAMAYIKKQGLPAGIGGHALETVQTCEKAGVGADYYVKTLHTLDYFSARRPDQGPDVLASRHDNFWCSDPKATIDFMETVNRPWFAFKVMAAGAIPPRKAFEHAFRNGADFILAGMFDFQIGKDAQIAKQVLAKVTKGKRSRPWRA